MVFLASFITFGFAVILYFAVSTIKSNVDFMFHILVKVISVFYKLYDNNIAMFL